MRFMIIRKADQDTEAGVLPDQQLLEAMGITTSNWSRRASCAAATGCNPAPRALA
jgi:hypothetical protein